MTIEHDDDLLLTSIAAGSPAPEGDALASLLAAWHADIAADPLPTLRPATERDRLPLPVPLPGPRRRPSPFRRTSAPEATRPPTRRRFPRPAVVAAAAAVLAFGGLTFASASAQPGTPLWPITRIIFGDTAKSRVAAQEAEKLLDQARTAIAAGDKLGAAKLVNDARAQIALVTDPEVQKGLVDEANALWSQLTQLPNSTGPGGTPLPGQSGQPGQPTPSPSTGGGILPPLPTISVPPLLPSGILPDLPPLPLIG